MTTIHLNPSNGGPSYWYASWEGDPVILTYPDGETCAISYLEAPGDSVPGALRELGRRLTKLGIVTEPPAELDLDLDSMTSDEADRVLEEDGQLLSLLAGAMKIDREKATDIMDLALEFSRDTLDRVLTLVAAKGDVKLVQEILRYKY